MLIYQHISIHTLSRFACDSSDWKTSNLHDMLLFICMLRYPKSDFSNPLLNMPPKLCLSKLSAYEVATVDSLSTISEPTDSTFQLSSNRQASRHHDPLST